MWYSVAGLTLDLVGVIALGFALQLVGQFLR